MLVGNAIMDYDFNNPRMFELLKKLTFRKFENNTYKEQYDQFVKICNDLSNWLSLLEKNIKNLPDMSQADQMKFFHFYSIVTSAIGAEISNTIRTEVNESQNLLHADQTSVRNTEDNEINPNNDDDPDNQSDPMC